ncbi:MAG: hypothetical protein RSC05_15600, partial [Acinetobacter sp.]
SSSDTNIYLYFNQQVLENISTYFRYELVSICTENGISSFRLRDQEKDILYDVNIEKGTVILSDENNPKGVTLK